MLLLLATTACGGASNGGTTDAGVDSAAPMMLVSAANPFAVAADATNVYFLTDSATAGMLASLPIDGGSVTTLASGLATHLDYGHAIAVDAANVYFLANGAVNSVPIGGGTVTVLAAPPRGAVGIAVSAGHVYWGSGGAEPQVGVVNAVLIDGGDTTTVASGVLPLDVAADASSVYWGGLDGTINKALLADGTTTVLGRGTGIPRQLAVDLDNVYWDASDGTVDSVPISGGAVAVLNSYAGGQPDGMNGLAKDDARVMWAQQDGDVDAIPLAGETDQTRSLIASGASSAWGIAANASGTYWVIHANPGAIMKLVR